MDRFIGVWYMDALANRGTLFYPEKEEGATKITLSEA